jgi:hypothetical protein
VARATGDGFETRGWWRIAPGGCAQTLSAQLTGGETYVHAQLIDGDACARWRAHGSVLRHARALHQPDPRSLRGDRLSARPVPPRAGRRERRRMMRLILMILRNPFREPNP